MTSRPDDKKNDIILIKVPIEKNVDYVFKTLEKKNYKTK